MQTLTPSQALAAAIQAIDEQFEPGYAACHPEMLAGMVQAVAMLEIDKSICDLGRNISC
jgi:hypothetical protein